MALLSKFTKLNESLEKLYKITQLSKGLGEQFNNVIILQSYNSVDYMIQIWLIEQGWDVSEDGFVLGRFKNINTHIAINFAIQLKILPEECEKDLCSLRMSRNKTAHSIDLDKEAVIESYRSFDQIEEWFLCQLNFMDDVDVQTEERTRDRIFSLEDVVIHGLSIDSKIVSAYEKLTSDERLNQMSLEVTELNHQVLMLKKELNDVSKKVDQLSMQIQNMSYEIQGAQQMVTGLLDKMSDWDQKEKTIAHFIDQYLKTLVYTINSDTSQKMYTVEEEKLILKFGDEAWNKLSDNSRKYLTTAKVTFNQYLLLDDIVDYSGVCVLVSKAMEVELKKRFFYAFLDYLHKKYGDDYDQYPSPLTKRNQGQRVIIDDEDFTMGKVAFVICYKEDNNVNSNIRERNKEQILSYCHSELLLGKSDIEISELLQDYAIKIENVRTNYRNPCAHVNELTKVSAQECLDLVIEVQQILKHMLDDFAF